MFRRFIPVLAFAGLLAGGCASTYQLVLDDREGTEVQVSERQSKRLREMLRG